MDDENMDLVDQFRFTIVDYAVFGAMLLLSALTGLYYGCRSTYCKNQGETLRDYLSGNGNMKPFPVAMSLVARSVGQLFFKFILANSVIK